MKVILVAAVLAACGSAHRTEPVSSPHSTPLAQLSATIEDRCNDCHGAGIGPDLSGIGRGEPGLLWSAAEQVASNQMPPNDKMTTQERSAIVRQLCDALQGDAALCARTMLLDDLPVVSRTPDVIARDVQHTWKLPAATNRTLGGLANAKVQSYTYDNVDLNVELSLSAVEGCSVMADGETPRSPEEIDRCVRGMIDRKVVRPLPVPAPEVTK